jgi:cell division septation protein DedD
MAPHQQHNSGESRPLRQLFLLLFTAAVSFALGIIIGRSSAPVQPIIKVTMPAEAQPATAQNFNFYKALPKGETTALGSGINHKNTIPAPKTPPPATISQAETAVPAAPSQKSKETPPTSAQKSGPQESQSAWILQASSSPREESAQSLSKRLRSKGYKTEVKPVQIKGKTWFRVYVGPYTTAAATKEAAAKLSRQEGLAPIARKI